MSIPTRYLSTAEAAEYIGVSKNTLRSYVAKKIIPAHRVGARLLKFDRIELGQVIKSRGR
ncbi:helix-turn-helix domain-containing protein [Mycobacteroides franklinii]|uniref:Helix-turn-helix domain protein n=1 Tax=Mycobacteroides franklinii TaxID=948102 RepID=A0A4R8QZW4_9MYCO|nr:Helix-turn-helix domain protein [Mycobacteroides franklinii]TDZ49104.1 Helix-turn-helix domain protein [Mycobacteroides franklinii]TDZ59285.1 Helix-turn-helix domain protein [Mycobacteroides franklinii]TDZ66799.1 Helix-turn-helix domain protein [Mycobacteroides franklinii]TDZ72722.1 Helix-turn-helix domain protein [Mycobacteroides franklinii]